MFLDPWLAKMPALSPLLATWWFHPLLVFVLFVSVASALERLGELSLRRWLGTADGSPGQIVLDRLVRPVTGLIALGGVHYASLASDLPEIILARLTSSLATAAVALGVFSASQAAVEAMARASEIGDRQSWFQPHTIPLFEMLVKVLAVTLAVNLIFLAWHVDLSAWLTHAGLLGVVMGFAAQETLGNLFAGMTIFIDQPYKIGDFLVLEDKIRGRVVDIGLRSTRMITADSVEVIIPNKQIANGRVSNMSTGALPWERFRIPVQVAYGTDLDAAIAALLQMAAALPLAIQAPDAAPTARATGLADSGINLELTCHARPEDREQIVDSMIRGAYTALARAGVSIPFPQVDVHLPPAAPTR